MGSSNGRPVARTLPGLPRPASKLARLLANGFDDRGRLLCVPRSLFAGRGPLAPASGRPGGEPIDSTRPVGSPSASISRGSLRGPRERPRDPPVSPIPAAPRHRRRQHGALPRSPNASRRSNAPHAVARLPASARLAGPAKRALRSAPNRPVPPEIWNRRKQGFTIPFDRWLRSGRLDLPLPTHPAFDPVGL